MLMLGIHKVEDLTTGNGRMERRAATGTEREWPMFMYAL